MKKISCPICEWDSVKIKEAKVEKASSGRYTVTIIFECINEHRWKIVTRELVTYQTEQVATKL